jgi:hypothetical protein
MSRAHAQIAIDVQLDLPRAPNENCDDVAVVVQRAGTGAAAAAAGGTPPRSKNDCTADSTFPPLDARKAAATEASEHVVNDMNTPYSSSIFFLLLFLFR